MLLSKPSRSVLLRREKTAPPRDDGGGRTPKQGVQHHRSVRLPLLPPPASTFTRFRFYFQIYIYVFVFNLFVFTLYKHAINYSLSASLCFYRNVRTNSTVMLTRVLVTGRQSRVHVTAIALGCMSRVLVTGASHGCYTRVLVTGASHGCASRVGVTA